MIVHQIIFVVIQNKKVVSQSRKQNPPIAKYQTTDVELNNWGQREGIEAPGLEGNVQMFKMYLYFQ